MAKSSTRSDSYAKYENVHRVMQTSLLIHVIRLNDSIEFKIFLNNKFCLAWKRISSQQMYAFAEHISQLTLSLHQKSSSSALPLSTTVAAAATTTTTIKIKSVDKFVSGFWERVP